MQRLLLTMPSVLNLRSLQFDEVVWLEAPVFSSGFIYRFFTQHMVLEDIFDPYLDLTFHLM